MNAKRRVCKINALEGIGFNNLFIFYIIYIISDRPPSHIGGGARAACKVISGFVDKIKHSSVVIVIFLFLFLLSFGPVFVLLLMVTIAAHLKPMLMIIKITYFT